MEKDFEFFKNLLEAKSPSSVESEAIKVWDDYMSKLGYMYHTYEDKIGNSGWSIGNGPTKILFSGHLDEIAFAVSGISEDGFITLASMAGPDKKCLPGGRLLILTDENTWIPGIIQKAPIHIEGREKTIDKAIELENVKLDIGASNKEEVHKLGIFPGSPVVFERNINLEFGENKLYGNALDDKVAVYIISQIAKNLDRSKTEIFDKYTFIFLAGTQEESGLRGLTVAAHNINPDISIDLDVTFATDGGLISPKYGDIKLGKGPVLESGQDKSRRILQELLKIAKEKEINIQRGFARCGGTNTNAIQLNAKDCETMLVSIPNMSMHTPNETCDWRDIEGAIKLILGYIENL